MAVHVAIILGAYLLGSISTAVLVCRLWGLPDPRAGGSGNPGATNVLRIAGKAAAAITLLGDVLKGVIPVAAAHWLEAPEPVLGAVALGAVLGHLFPVFFQLKGGKGVATALGAVTTLAWPVGLAMAATWLLMAGLFRYSSVASMTAALFAPFYLALLGYAASLVLCMSAISALLIVRHRGNIQRLLRGTESRIGTKSAS